MNKYQDKWEERSSIRTSPRKYIDFNKSGYFFPASKQPLLLLQEVVMLGEDVKFKILLHSFYKYLDDIINLETKVLISACNLIMYKDMRVLKYTSDTRLNAHTVLIDEYYHVYMAKDMINQLEQKFQELPKLVYPISDAYTAVQLIKSKLEHKYHDIFEIIAVCIFETTLVKELVEFFNSPDVHPSIRYYVNDHMNDESKHYGYFYEVLCYTWNNIPDEYKDAIGMHIGDFIKLYLNVGSEKEFNEVLLSSVLGDKNEANRLINELYKGFAITADIPIVKNVLNVLNKADLLTNSNVEIGLTKHNLIL